MAGDIPDAWVTAALAADLAAFKADRAVVWHSVPRHQARVIIAGVVPLIEASVRRRVAGEIRDRASSLWPPGMHRDQLHAAADAVVRGGEGQERSDEKEAGHGQH